MNQNKIISQAIRRANVVKPISQSEVTDPTRWKTLLTFGCPAYIVNPKYGTCIIRSRRITYEPVFGRKFVYYLVNLVRPQQNFVDNTSSSSSSTSYLVDTSKFYQVPAFLPHRGFCVSYIKILPCIITEINYDQSNPNNSVIGLRYKDVIKEISLKQFVYEIRSSPNHSPNMDYKRALAALEKTNPEFIKLDLSITRISIPDTFSSSSSSAPSSSFNNNFPSSQLSSSAPSLQTSSLLSNNDDNNIQIGNKLKFNSSLKAKHDLDDEKNLFTIEKEIKSDKFIKKHKKLSNFINIGSIIFPPPSSSSSLSSSPKSIHKIDKLILSSISSSLKIK